MGRADYLALGDHNAVCYECGRKFKASELRKHWQGYYVCPEHWEPRHPQDYARAVGDKITPPWAQPVPADTFLNLCVPNGRTALPGQALPGCVISGYIDPFADPINNACSSSTSLPKIAMPGCAIPGYI